MLSETLHIEAVEESIKFVTNVSISLVPFPKYKTACVSYCGDQYLGAVFLSSTLNLIKLQIQIACTSSWFSCRFQTVN